jgi:hypothetical protein
VTRRFTDLSHHRPVHLLQILKRNEKQERMGVQDKGRSSQALVLLFIVSGVCVVTTLPYTLDYYVWGYLLIIILGRDASNDNWLNRLRPVAYEVRVLFQY